MGSQYPSGKRNIGTMLCVIVIKSRWRDRPRGTRRLTADESTKRLPHAGAGLRSGAESRRSC
ncbi:TPA: hypothetical protein ACF6U4_001741, partial [Burkholderia multivorans]